MKRLILFLILVLLRGSNVYASIANIYFSNAGGGAGDGSSCLNALAVSGYNTPGNWGAGATQIGAGTTVHFCGTINVPLNNGAQNVFLFAQGSGTTNNPIIHIWEPGATFTSAAMYIAFSTLSGPALGGTKQSWLTYDGNCLVNGTSPGLAGNPCATPSITNTANGTNLANQVASAGIFSDTCNNCEFKNLSITNIYVNVPDVDTLGGVELWIEADNAQHVKIHDNFMTHANQGILSAFASSSTDYQVYNNTMQNCQHCAEMKGNGTAVAAPALILHDNHITTLKNWDLVTPTTYHHNAFGPLGNNINCTGPFQDTVKIYNNIFDGDQGSEYPTAWVFLSCGVTHVYVFNNIFIMTPLSASFSTTLGFSGTDPTGDLNYVTVNNTFISTGGAASSFHKQWSATNAQIQNNAFQESGGGGVYLATGANPVSTPGQVIDFNAYDLAGSGGAFAFSWNSAGQTFTQWRAAFPAFDSHSITPASLNLDAVTHKPKVGSALISAGTNLTASLCGTVPEICTDKAGVARPSGVTAWDIGAFQFVSTPNAPVSMRLSLMGVGP